MKDIKFRAWDKKNKCWFKQINPQGNPLYNHYISFDGWVWKKENINSNDPEKNDSLSKGEFELSQYTGLKDKNGKEIYEGDVLEFSQEEMNISVRWDITSGSWQFTELNIFLDDGHGRGNWDFNMGVAKNSKIIGNIYENPELLNLS